MSEELEYQVEKEELENPFCVRVFKTDGKLVDNLKEKLNGLRVRFAEVKPASSIEIFIEEKDLEDN